MTSLNPSHNVFRHASGRHAQAVHEPSSPDEKTGAGFPDDLGVDDTVERARRDGWDRVRRGMVPVPDLRFEQSYLLSIRPFLHPTPTRSDVADRGNVESTPESKSLVTSADADEVFHWGRQVSVDWAAVGWVTLRDQLISPLFQGMFWGVAGVVLASTAASLRSALYPASHVPRGRITGGPGGKISGPGEAGGGEAVGGPWWRKFVGSVAGGLETAAA